MYKEHLVQLCYISMKNAFNKEKNVTCAVVMLPDCVLSGFRALTVDVIIFSSLSVSRAILLWKQTDCAAMYACLSHLEAPFPLSGPFERSSQGALSPFVCVQCCAFDLCRAQLFSSLSWVL